MEVFRDERCTQPMQVTGAHHTTTLEEIREHSQGSLGKLYYMHDNECHKAEITDRGFHLTHEDKFFECDTHTSTILECIVGPQRAELHVAKKKHGDAALALHHMAAHDNEA